MITYGYTIFFTSTYSRDRPLDTCWRHANIDFNRYIQKLRRLSKDSIQYLRTIEAHRDNYPHFHAVLRFSTILTINNGRYFDKTLYKRWKSTWPHGHSDAQAPYPGQSALAYIIKYTTKESGNKIWMKYYLHHDAPSADSRATSSSLQSTVPSVHPVSPLSITCEKYKIKQCTWSRNFFKAYIKPDTNSLDSLDDDYT